MSFADSADSELWSIFQSFEDAQVSKSLKKNCDELYESSCTACKDGGKVHLEDGNYICILCGYIVERFIDTAAEWRYYGFDDSKGNDPTRCGLPMNELLPDSSLGSLIGYTTKETHELRIMRKYHMWNSMTYKERTLYNVFDTLTVNAVNNGINKSIIDEAKMLYKKISELKITRGENRNGLIASSIYMACKRNKVPRSAKEIAFIFNLKVTTMTKGCKKFQELLNMNMDATGPNDFIARYCSKLNLESNMRDLCKSVINKIEELCIMTENTPPSVAVATIYMCNSLCGWGLTKVLLAEVCEISQVTISKCCTKLMKYKNEILPNDVLEAIEIAKQASLSSEMDVKKTKTRKQSNKAKKIPADVE